MRARYIHPDHDQRNPLYSDVHYGRGGIAGGKFLMVNDAQSVSSVETSGTAQSGSSNSITLATAASSTDDAYNGMSIQLTGGTGSGQDHQRITDYNGSTQEATVSGSWTTTPDSTTTYRIVNRAY